MKCYNCGNNLYKTYNYCPKCGKLRRMCSTKLWMTTMSDSAQANRIKENLNKIMKKLGIARKDTSSKKRGEK